MKKTILISFLILIFSCKENHKVEKLETEKTDKVINSISSYENKIIDTLNVNKHKVIKIDSIGDVYLIYAKKEDVYYKILSDKINSVNKCNKVIVGHYYDLKVKSVFPKTSFKKPYFGILYNEQEIEIERDSINDLHFAENLRGLCIEDI